MKVLLKAIVIVCFSVMMVSAQSYKWEKIDPKFDVQGNYNLSNGTFIDKNTGWFTEYNGGRMWKTTDGGYNWEKIKDGANVYSTRLFFVDDSTGWTYEQNNSLNIYRLLKTENGGRDWEKIGNTFIEDMFFFDKKRGFATGGNSIKETEDGGTNWVETDVSIEYGETRKIFFTSTEKGYINNVPGFDGSQLIMTTDSGDSWHFSATWFPESKDMDFFDENFGCSVGYYLPGGNWISTTTNAGESWFHYELTTEDLLNSVAYSDSNNVWIVGDSGLLWHSSDSGFTWEEKESETTENLNEIIFLKEEKVGYIFGDNNYLMKFEEIPNAVEEENDLPAEFKLFQNYPNPFSKSSSGNASTVIKFVVGDAPRAVDVTLKVYDVLGKEIETLVNKNLSAGKYEVEFDGKDLPAGIYLYRLQTETFAETRKMLLLK